MRPAMFKYSLMSKGLAISKYVIMFEWQLNLTLASFPLLADYSSVKLTSENIIKAIANCKYLNSIQNLPEDFLNLFCFI